MIIAANIANNNFYCLLNFCLCHSTFTLGKSMKWASNLCSFTWFLSISTSPVSLNKLKLCAKKKVKVWIEICFHFILEHTIVRVFICVCGVIENVYKHRLLINAEVLLEFCARGFSSAFFWWSCFVYVVNTCIRVTRYALHVARTCTWCWTTALRSCIFTFQSAVWIRRYKCYYCSE